MEPTMSKNEPFSMIQSYLGLDRRILWRLLSLVGGTFAVVTLIYSSIFGFDAWATNMRRAGSMMIIAFQPEPAGGAIQYRCPVHGAVGLPRTGPDGTPQCPLCNGPMNRVSPAVANARPAAGP